MTLETLAMDNDVSNLSIVEEAALAFNKYVPEVGRQWSHKGKMHAGLLVCMWKVDEVDWVLEL